MGEIRGRFVFTQGHLANDHLNRQSKDWLRKKQGPYEPEASVAGAERIGGKRGDHRQ